MTRYFRSTSKFLNVQTPCTICDLRFQGQIHELHLKNPSVLQGALKWWWKERGSNHDLPRRKRKPFNKVSATVDQKSGSGVYKLFILFDYYYYLHISIISSSGLGSLLLFFLHFILLPLLPVQISYQLLFFKKPNKPKTRDIMIINIWNVSVH
jgi:hypothetical protein